MASLPIGNRIWLSTDPSSRDYRINPLAHTATIEDSGDLQQRGSSLAQLLCPGISGIPIL